MDYTYKTKHLNVYYFADGFSRLYNQYMILWFEQWKEKGAD